jgi:hypothetical protein
LALPAQLDKKYPLHLLLRLMENWLG